MTRSIAFRRAAAAVGALGLALASFMAVSPMVAQASQGQAPDGGQAPPRSTKMLFLSVTTRTGPITTAVLTCDPPGGLHPDPRGACADLETAGGDFTKLPDRRPLILCPDIYDPVLATAFGWWDGRVVWYSQIHSNSCQMYGVTGPVFPVPQPGGPTPTRPTSTFPDPTLPGPTRPTSTRPGPTIWDPPPPD
jgi:Subtilisin inhibitor-like